MLIIDTHAHIYSPDERKYPVIEKPLRPPGGKGSVEDLRADSRAAGVRAVCAIQTSTFYRFDNRYILDSAVAHPDWIAAVCTLDPDDPHSPGLLKHYAEKYGIRGMRSIAARDGRLDHPGVRALWKAASEAGIVINILIGHEKADQAGRMIPDFPSLPLVLDHCMNPKAGPELEVIVAKVEGLSRFRNLHAKLTFLATGSESGYPCEDMHKPCLRILKAFGSERCIWGSDFPCELWTPRVSYRDNLRLFTEALSLSERDRANILGMTARRLFFPKLNEGGD